MKGVDFQRLLSWLTRNIIMKIIIIRHAEPDYKNKTLTNKGFREAELLGKYLKDTKIDYMYSSPLPRARFTADAIVKYNKTKTYEVFDYLREFDSRIDLPYANNHLLWDLRPSFLNDNKELYDINKWTDASVVNDKVKAHYQSIKDGFSALLEKHGYKKKGVYYDVVKPNHDNIVIACHFGLGSFLLSELLNIAPSALLNHTCAQASSVTTVVTEERVKSKAIFRMLSFGSIEHLVVNDENPSFMARFDEVYGDGNGKFDEDDDE